MDVLRVALDDTIRNLPIAQQEDARKMRGVVKGMAHKVNDVLKFETAAGRKVTVRGFRKYTVPAAKLLDQLCNLLRDAKRIPATESLGGNGRWGNAAARINCLSADWGKMRTAMAQVSIPRSDNAKVPRRRWSDEGSVPVAMHRWCTDQRMFVIKKRMKGGTLLLDASGSMSFSAADIANIVKQAPNATVAMYSGSGGRGQLTVIARRGMAASEREIKNIRCDVGAGNVVDGPALVWLEQQAEPRVWMSDLGVSGKGDACSASLRAECLHICQRGNIAVVRNIDAATLHFASVR